MIIIGEKINGSIPAVKEAIDKRDAAFIADRAVKQAAAGADFIDVCASTAPELEIETLKWLIEVVQAAVETPLCIDSPNPRAIEAVFQYANKPGLLNSISEEGDKCAVLLPLLAGNSWEVVGLTCDNNGIPCDLETKLKITKSMVEKADKFGITPDRIHIDPCVMALSTENNSLLNPRFNSLSANALARPAAGSTEQNARYPALFLMAEKTSPLPPDQRLAARGLFVF